MRDYNCLHTQTNTYFLNDAKVPAGPGPPHYQGFKITLT